MLPPAYRNRILQVDLSTGRQKNIATDSYVDLFLGGRGIATALYRDLVPPKAPWDGDENALIAMTGPLAGLPGIGGSRWGLFAKSPAAYRRPHFCYGNLGGSVGAEIKFAGFDGFALTGRAESLSVLVIRGGAQGGRAVLEDAEEWTGLGAASTILAAKERFGKGAKTLAVGPAGESRIPFASVLAEGGASCSGGMGAVMGAKNLKAVVLFGDDRKLAAFDRAALKNIEKRIRSWERGNVKVWGLDFMATGEKTRKMPCYGCMANCLRVKYHANDGSAGKFMCQSRFFYMALSWAYYGEENDAAYQANRLCDEAGLDTWAVQDLVDWLVRCRDEGALDNEISGLPLESIGSLEFAQALVKSLLERRGFGALMAKGAEEAALEFGGAAEEQFRHHDPYEPRYCPVNTFLIPFESRIPIQQLHEAGLTVAKWSTWAKGTPGAHVDSTVVQDIARRFWGGDAAGDFTTLDGKAQAARLIQNRQLAKECLCVCDWMYPVLDIPPHGQSESTNHGLIGDPELEAEVLRATIGGDWSAESLAQVGERVFQVQRAILLAEGHRPLEDDVLPAEWHHVPLDGHVADPDCLVPGPDGNPVSRLGAVIAMEDYLPARDEFFLSRGWDCPSGLPARPHLEFLELGFLADDLAKRGLLAKSARSVSLATRLKRWTQRQRSSKKSPGAQAAPGPSLESEDILSILEREREKYAHPAIAHNFESWNKVMLYRFSDQAECYVIRFLEGSPQAPECLEVPWKTAEIEYEMHSSVLAAMDQGRITGLQAYRNRQLKTKAAFGDLMKLQALNKLNQ